MTNCNTVTTMTKRNLPVGVEGLSREEAADALGVSLSTVDRYLRDGLLDKIRIGKRRVLIPEESIAALVVVEPSPERVA